MLESSNGSSIGRRGSCQASTMRLKTPWAKYRNLNSMPIARQKEILRAYCDDHPAATYRNGINALMNYLTIAPSELPPGHPLDE
jgi:hypothetical protein